MNIEAMMAVERAKLAAYEAEMHRLIEANHQREMQAIQSKHQRYLQAQRVRAKADLASALATALEGYKNTLESIRLQHEGFERQGPQIAESMEKFRKMRIDSAKKFYEETVEWTKNNYKKYLGVE